LSGRLACGCMPGREPCLPRPARQRASGLLLARPQGGGSPSSSPREGGGGRAPPARAAAPARPAAGARASSAAPRPAARPAPASGGGGGSGGGALEDEGSLSAGAFTKEQAEATLTELFSEATTAALSDALWKVRGAQALGPHRTPALLPPRKRAGQQGGSSGRGRAGT
jgi:hypothetical protein